MSARGQPDNFTAHFEYVNRTKTGTAVVVVEDIKLGRQVSTLHLTLWQGDEILSQAPWVDRSRSRRAVLGYLNQINFSKFNGITVPTGFESTTLETLPPTPDFEALASTGQDANWLEDHLPEASWQRLASMTQWRMFLPKETPSLPGIADMWVCLANGENITQDTLPFAVDSYPNNVHISLASPEVRELMIEAAKADELAKKNEGSKGSSNKPSGSANGGGMWFPTVVLNLEIKKALPEGGVKWLAMRFTAKQIANGKFDLDVIVRDDEGEVVALSTHVIMVLSMARNTAGRAKPKAAL